MGFLTSFRNRHKLAVLLTVCFNSPKAPTIAPPTPAPPPPTIDQAAQSQQQTNLIRQRRGAASNILAGPNPNAPPTTGVARLLGS